MSDTTRVTTGNSVQPPSDTEPKAPDSSLGELMSRLGEDLSGLVSTQLEIAKAEIRQEAGQTAKAAGMFGGGAVAGHLALLLLSMAAAWGIAEALEPWAGFLIVGILWAVVATVLALNGKEKLSKVSGPEATSAELDADRRLVQDLRS